MEYGTAADYLIPFQSWIPKIINIRKWTVL
jgi:hypothetical protein